MPFCHQCGATNPDSARFCDQCGVELINVPTQSSSGSMPAPFAIPSGGGGPGAVDTCPQCGMAVIPGEAFCDNCGAPLLKPAIPAPSQEAAVPPPFRGVPPQVSYPPPQPVGVAPLPLPPVPPAPPQPVGVAPLPLPPVPPSPPPPSPPMPSASVYTTLRGAQLVLQGGAVTLPLPAAAQVFVGRADAMSQFYPDIDLTTYNGLEQGVGRRHLRLFVQNGQVYVEDLDSTNGTFLNGQKLAAHSVQLVRNGDEVRLGRLVVRIQL